MKCRLIVGIVLVLLATGITASADNITVYDGDGYVGTGAGGENGEAEPGCINSQAWDMEAVIYEAGQLTLIAGWDFPDGAPGYSLRSGDLFISLDEAGPLRDGPGAEGSWGYDLVFDMDWPAIGGNTASGTMISYDLIDITGPGISLSTVSELITQPESNPFRYESGGTVIGSGSTLFQIYDTDEAVNAAFADDLSGANALTGGVHYSLTFNWSPPGGGEFWTHFTEECGNDNLMSKSPVPEPSTMVLLGIGMLGMALRQRFPA
jgi:hypothetical protein